MDPSLYYMNYNPLRPYWFYRPPYSGKDFNLFWLTCYLTIELTVTF
jgi:hypothetical protein